MNQINKCKDKELITGVDIPGNSIKDLFFVLILLCDLRSQKKVWRLCVSLV